MSNEYVWVDSDPDVFRFIPGHDKKSWNDAKLGYNRPKNYSLLNPAREAMPQLKPEEGVAVRKF